MDAEFPDGALKAGQSAKIVGTVTGSDRRINVQVETDNGWLTVASTTSDENGNFAAPAPTYWVGDHDVRVTAPATDTYQAASSSEGKVTTKRTYKPRPGTAWKHLTSSAKVRWDPCEVIDYSVNPKRMPKTGLADVRGAFKRISAATGLRFKYAGKTKFVPLSGKGSPNASMTIAWATPKMVPGLAGTTIGRGGAMWYSSTTRGFHEAVSGYAVLDSTWKAKGGFGKGATWGALLLHEIGHAIGLGHVEDSRQIMNGQLSASYAAEFASGDLRGLAAIGAKNGCF